MHYGVNAEPTADFRNQFAVANIAAEKLGLSGHCVAMSAGQII
jgi:hypothetical protein